MNYSPTGITRLLALIALVVLCVSYSPSSVRAQKSKAYEANDSSAAPHKSSRLDFDKLRTMMDELTNLKGASVSRAHDSKVNRVLELDFNSPHNWHGMIGMAVQNDDNIYLVFPCRKVDPKDDREEYFQRLLDANRGLGLMRFEVTDYDMVRLILPLANEDMTAEKLDRHFQSLLRTAESTARVWNNKPATKKVAVADPLPKASESSTPPNTRQSTRSAIPISGSAPPGTGAAVPGTRPTQERLGSVGTTPTQASTPSAGTVPEQTEVKKVRSSDICQNDNMRIGSMAFKDSSNFGTIILGPDGSFAGTITNPEGTYNNKDKGTWSVVEGQLELTIGSGDKIQFKTISMDDGEIKMKTKDGFIEITLPKIGE